MDCVLVGVGSHGRGFPSSPWSLPGLSGAADPRFPAEGDADPDVAPSGLALACFPSLGPCRPGTPPPTAGSPSCASAPRCPADRDGLARFPSSSPTLMQPAVTATVRAAAARRTGTYMARTGSHLRKGSPARVMPGARGRMCGSPCPTPAARRRTRDGTRRAPGGRAARPRTRPDARRTRTRARRRAQAPTRTQERARVQACPRSPRAHPRSRVKARCAPHRAPRPGGGPGPDARPVCRSGGRRAGRRQPYPRACSRASSMPKWWAISCTTVTSVSATTSSRVPHIRSVGPR